MRSFQPFRSHYLCIVVFCLLFSIGNYVQHQVCHSIITQNNDVNSKQLSWTPAYPSVIKHFRWECLWHHSQESIHVIITKTMIIDWFLKCDFRNNSSSNYQGVILCWDRNQWYHYVLGIPDFSQIPWNSEEMSRGNPKGKTFFTTDLEGYR